MLNWDDPFSAPIAGTAEAKKEEEKAEQAEAAAPAANDLTEAPASAEVKAMPLSNAKPVNVDDKRVVNGDTDINQLAPFKYPWAWNYFLNANKNHWTPLDINMAQDVHDYRHKLTMEERHVYENVLSYLTTSDILAMRNIGLAVMEKMAAPELQIYQARQVYEEALHTWTYQHCIETIGLDQSEIYNRYRVVPEIYQKIKLANDRLNTVLRSDIDLRDRDELENFVMSYAFFGGIFEGKAPPNSCNTSCVTKSCTPRSVSASASRSLKKKTSNWIRRKSRPCLKKLTRLKKHMPVTFCETPSWVTQKKCTTASSVTPLTVVPNSSALKNRSPVPKPPCPGLMNRPICGRRKTSSRPKSPSTRQVLVLNGTKCRFNG